MEGPGRAEDVLGVLSPGWGFGLQGLAGLGRAWEGRGHGRPVQWLWRCAVPACLDAKPSA